MLFCGMLARTIEHVDRNPTGRAGKHRLSKSLEYGSWVEMRRRCYDPKNHNYPKYGGRGIEVCSRWFEFLLFREDMGPRPSRAHTLDRVDNDRGYEKSNCRWATKSEQSRNRPYCELIEFQGRRMCVTDWARELTLKPGTIEARLHRYGWSVERALSSPTRVWPGKAGTSEPRI